MKLGRGHEHGHTISLFSLQGPGAVTPPKDPLPASVCEVPSPLIHTPSKQGASFPSHQPYAGKGQLRYWAITSILTPSSLSPARSLWPALHQLLTHSSPLPGPHLRMNNRKATMIHTSLSEGRLPTHCGLEGRSREWPQNDGSRAVCVLCSLPCQRVLQ